MTRKGSRSVNLPESMVLLIDEAIRKKLTWAKSRDEFVRRWVELGVTFVLHGRDGQTLIRTLEELARKQR